MPITPAPIAPRPRPESPGRKPVWRRIIAGPAPRMATAHPRGAHPGARPDAVPLDRLVRIGRAARQIAALPPKQARERQLIEADHHMRGAARREGERAHDAGADALAPSRAAIWPSASATALKVSRVEAWRAL